MEEILYYIELITEWLGNLTDLFSGAAGFVKLLSTLISAVAVIASSIVTILTAVVSIGGLLVTIVGGIAAFVVAVALYIFSAFPYYKLGKKAGVKFAWLAWVPIPVLDFCFRLYVLSQIPGERPVTVFGDKFTIPNRFLVFWGYMGIRFLGGTVVIPSILAILTPIMIMIPLVGEIYLMLIPLIYLIPSALVVFLEFAFLYDALCVFKENKKANLIAAIVVTLIDNLFTLNLPVMGIATTIYLYTLLKRQPLEQAAPAEAEIPFIEDTTPALEATAPEALPEEAVEALPEEAVEALPEEAVEALPEEAVEALPEEVAETVTSAED